MRGRAVGICLVAVCTDILIDLCKVSAYAGISDLKHLNVLFPPNLVYKTPFKQSVVHTKHISANFVA